MTVVRSVQNEKFSKIIQLTVRCRFASQVFSVNLFIYLIRTSCIIILNGNYRIDMSTQSTDRHETVCFFQVQVNEVRLYGLLYGCHWNDFVFVGDLWWK